MNKFASMTRPEPHDEGLSPVLPRPLPDDDAIAITELARVPEDNQDQFLRGVSGCVADVWKLEMAVDRREALLPAAEFARSLHLAIGRLDPIDLEGVDYLRRWTPGYNFWLRDLPQTVFELAHLLSIAAGHSPPRQPGEAAPSHQKTDRDRTIRNLSLMFLCRWLKLLAHELGGKLGADRLLKVIQRLKPHLPQGVVPTDISKRMLKDVPSYISLHSFDPNCLEPPARCKTE